MMTDPIADLLTQIKNGYLARLDTITVPYSHIKEEIVLMLAKQSLVRKAEVKIGESGHKQVEVHLFYENKKPKITNILRVSRPGKRVYVGKKEIPRVLGGLGLSILSTSKGLMTDKEARKQKIGGELICKIW